MRTAWTGFVLAIGSWAIVAPDALAKTPIDQTVRAPRDVEVKIENVVGSVTVEAWDRNEVHVGGMLGDDVEQLVIDPDEDEISIEVVLPERVRNRVEATNLEIRVPRDCDLDVETISASIFVSGVNGGMELESVSGEIRVSGNPEYVEAESVSGSIGVERARESIEVSSVSGHIEVGSAELVEAETTSGSLSVVGDRIRSLQLESVSGGVAFEGDPGPDCQFELESFSGGVEVTFPSDLNAEIEVETFSGEIESDFGGRVRREQHGPGASMRLVVGRGDGQVMISTFSGSVRIRERR